MITAHLRGFPATILYFLNAVVAVVVTFSGWHLSATNQHWIVVLSTAILGIIVAAATRPIQVPIIAGAFATGLTALAAFGIHLSAHDIGVFTTIVSLLVAFFTHQNVTPLASRR